MSRLSPELLDAGPGNRGATTADHRELFDIFISYRRCSGSELAQLVYAALVSRGHRVFLDVREMPAGSFDQTLMQTIAEAKDVVVLLTEECLDHCTQAEDWFREEIVRAIAGSANIVPLRTHGFAFPAAESLPAEVRPLLMRHILSYSHEHSEASLDNLCKRLHSHPLRTRKPVVLIGVAIAALLLAGSFAVWHRVHPSGPKTPPLIITMQPATPRLDVYHLNEGARVPLDPGEEPLPRGSDLSLVHGDAHGKPLYLLEINGQGRAELYDEHQLDQVKWGWTVDGPPALETLLLLCSDHPLGDSDRQQLTETINRLQLTPRVANQTLVVWSDGGARTLATAIPGRGPKDVAASDWQQRVLQTLKNVNGVSFSGFSMAVRAKP